MSTELGNTFGEDYGDEYASVVDDWTGRLDGAPSVTKDMNVNWGSDLATKLGPPAAAALVVHATKNWKAGPTPTAGVLKMFAVLAVKAVIAKQMYDLLHRLHTRVNTPPDKDGSPPAGSESVKETVNRAPQTTAQIFDMTRDGFDGILSRFYTRKGDLTGRRRWVTDETKKSPTSRHSALDGEVRNQDEEFSYEKTSFFGPRPPGGSPDHWSNCSCRISYEKKDGSWTDPM